MKTRNMGLSVLIFISLMCFSVIPASAGQGWYTCTVNTAGPGGSGIYIRLTDTAATPAFTNKWFEASADRAKEMLVVALTAISNDLMVTVLTDPAETGEPDIACFYLRAE